MIWSIHKLCLAAPSNISWDKTAVRHMESQRETRSPLFFYMKPKGYVLLSFILNFSAGICTDTAFSIMSSLKITLIQLLTHWGFYYPPLIHLKFKATVSLLPMDKNKPGQGCENLFGGLCLMVLFIFHFLQGVKPASYNKVMDPEIKEIIGECICQKKEER